MLQHNLVPASPSRGLSAGAGLESLAFHEPTSGFHVDAAMLEAPDRWFQLSPVWSLLTEGDRSELVSHLKRSVVQSGAIAVASPVIVALGMKSAR